MNALTHVLGISVVVHTQRCFVIDWIKKTSNYYKKKLINLTLMFRILATACPQNNE